MLIITQFLLNDDVSFNLKLPGYYITLLFKKVCISVLLYLLLYFIPKLSL